MGQGRALRRAAFHPVPEELDLLFRQRSVSREGHITVLARTAPAMRVKTCVRGMDTPLDHEPFESWMPFLACKGGAEEPRPEIPRIGVQST